MTRYITHRVPVPFAALFAVRAPVFIVVNLPPGDCPDFRRLDDCEYCAHPVGQ